MTVLGPDARLILVLRPSTAVTGPLEVRAFLAQGDRAAPFHPPVTVSPEGLVRIAGPRDTLFPGVSSGTARILLAVGRPGDLPPDSETTVTSLRDAAANARGAWILAEHELRWVDTAEPPP
ncbi:MAG: hypothetical protein R3B70_07260 [Polyangiaceae bacterium]